MYEIIRLTQLTPEQCDDIRTLLPQLDPTSPLLSDEELQKIVSNEVNTVLAAVENGRILGTLTVVIFPNISGIRCWIEDVVTGAEARGRGIGEALVKAGIACGKAAGADTIDLTSNPLRESANRLYRRCGMELRETNVYRAK